MGIRASFNLRSSAPILLLAGLAVVFLWPILASSSRLLLDGMDYRQYFLWMHQFSRDEILAGHWPLWNPFNQCGQPFAANPQSTIFYPPSWLYLVMPVTAAHKFMILTHVVMGGAFMFLFLRTIRLGVQAAVAGALPWMFGSYMLYNSSVGHLPMVFTAAWLPLVLAFYERALAGGRRWLFWTGMALGAQLLAGEPQSTYYTVLLLCGYGLARGGRTEGNAAGTSRLTALAHRAAGLAIVGVVAAGAALVQLAPTAELATVCDRSESSYTFSVNQSFPPSSALGLLLPGSLDHRVLGFFNANHTASLNWEFACYVGIATLALVVVSLRARGGAPLRTARWVAVVAIFLMLGRYTPVYRVLFAGLPGLAMFRIPARALLLLLWAISVMAATGLHHLMESDADRLAARRLLRLAAGVLVLIVVTGVIVAVSVPIAAGSSSGIGTLGAFRPLSPSDPILLRPAAIMLVTILLLVVLHRLPRRAVGPVILATVTLDLFLQRPSFPLIDVEQARAPALTVLQEAARQHGPDPAPYRVDFPDEMVSPNAAMVARVENVNGYWPLPIKRYYEFVHWMRGVTPTALSHHELRNELYATDDPLPLRILNVQIAGRRDADQHARVATLAPEAAPRAWLAERVEVCRSDEEALRRLRDATFDPRTTVLLEQPLALPLSPDASPLGSCEVRRRSASELAIDVQAARNAVLVLSEMNYPGWCATLDGQPVPVLRADDLITAIAVPSGRHRIAYRYEPLSVKLGLAGSAMTCVLAGILLFRTRGRGTDTPGPGHRR